MKTLKFHFNIPRFPASLHPRLPLSPYHLITLSLFLFLSTSLFAQREADNWIFGEWAGLNFTTGDPVPIFTGPYSSEFSGTIMSDSSGNILFYVSFDQVWNRNNEVMLNGNNLLPVSPGWRQNYISFPKPGTDCQYYIFSVSEIWEPKGMYYSVIDMSLDGGLGGVTSVKNIKLDAAIYAQDKLFALKNSQGDGYWVITRLFNDDRFACFRVTVAGVDPVPVYSSTGIYRPVSSGSGPMRVSPDKKHLISCYDTDLEPPSGLEVCSFDAETGLANFRYLTMAPRLHPYLGEAMDCEFSPDSKFLYVNYIGQDSGLFYDGLYQYNMQLVGDSATFRNSATHLLKVLSGYALQLSNDGRIYFNYRTDPALWDNQQKYLGVINRPWELGTDCYIDTTGVYLGGRNTISGLPNILLDYLYRFEWEAEDYCQGSTVHFIPHFLPTPDSIRWFFDEFAPGSISYELSPTYTFQNAGIHEISVDIWYPTGRFEHTSREIEISPTPEPDLGQDMVICEGTSVTLNANCVADMYSWSTGQIGNTSIMISDSGTYWVRASFFETGCAGFDTIHVGFHPATILDESELVITPTSCSGTSGSITGLYALGPAPFAYQWLDLSGNPFGTNIDATDLPAGQYILKVTDVNGCETISDIYTIEDAGNLQVTQVQTSRPHCYRTDGQIIISAFSPSGSTLEYSIDDGNSYATDSIFNDLPAGNYLVHIRDNNGCDGFYADNPVVMVDIPGPQVQPPVVINETDFSGNGSIEITATGSTPTLFYSNDNGNTYQSNNGTFNNLAAGTYLCKVKDENDCDTAFIVEIQNVIMTYLHAVTGEDGLCEDSAALIPVYVDNFNAVANFQLKLGYNADNLQCEGFINVHPQLLDSLTGWVDQAAGDIHLTWNGELPLTFSQLEKVIDLVFTTKNPGQGELSWYTGETVSYFTNSSGILIPAQFQAGAVEIYAPPEILSTTLEEIACIGQMVSLTRFADGNQPPIGYLWTYPDSHQDDSDPFFFAVTQADAGEYILVVTDQVGCSDQQIIQLIVSEDPVAAFHGPDTLEMHEGEYLDAGSGLSSYLWNTGDTTASIVINAEGMYSVQMASPIGCIGTDAVYVKLVSEEIPEFDIYIPNAFSPNGDGINDSFQIIFPHSTFNLQHSTLSIFDRWGGEIFSGDGVSTGWDGKKAGKDCPGGVYVYKIMFSVDGVPGIRERVGGVMLVR